MIDHWSHSTYDHAVSFRFRGKAGRYNVDGAYPEDVVIVHDVLCARALWRLLPLSRLAGRLHPWHLPGLTLLLDAAGRVTDVRDGQITKQYADKDRFDAGIDWLFDIGRARLAARLFSQRDFVRWAAERAPAATRAKLERDCKRVLAELIALEERPAGLPF